MASTKSHKFIGIQLHGCGVANSGDYPDICVSLEIEFNRISSSSKSVSWSVGDVDFQVADKGQYRYDYPFYCNLVVGNSSKWLIKKDSTSGSGWEDKCYINEDFSSSFSSTSSSVTVKFVVEGGHCMNDGEYCYGSSGDYTVYSKTVTIPSYSSGSSSGGGGGGGGSSTTYSVYYDAGKGGGTGVPDPQKITPDQPLTLSTKIPTWSIDMRYYNYPNGGSFDSTQFTDSVIANRRLHHWQSYYNRTLMHNWSGPCDGEHYTYPRHIVESQNINYAYAIPYGLQKVSGTNAGIRLTINSGLAIEMYHYTSGKAPQDTRYPYYYAIDTYTLPGDAYYEGKCITIGTLSNVSSGVFNPTPPPKGSSILLAYESQRYSYFVGSAGAEYQPGDTYDTTGDNGKRNVYMRAVWDSAVVTNVPQPDAYRNLIFDYNGGTGSPPSMAIQKEKLGYYFWYYRNQYIDPVDYRVYYQPNTKIDVNVERNQDQSTPTLHIEKFSGDGETTEFTLESPCCKVRYIKINGVAQSASAYIVYNRSLTFTSAPPEGTDNIEIMYDATDTIRKIHFTGDGTGNVFPVEYRCDYIMEVKINGEVQDLSRCSIEDDGFGIYVGKTPAEGDAIDIIYSTYTYVTNTFTGDGTTTSFTTEYVIALVDSVKVNGVIQDPSTYTYTDTAVTFTTAPAASANIEIKYYFRIIYSDYGCQVRLLGDWGVCRLPYNQLPMPTKKEHAFAGWYYDSALTEPVSREEGLIIPRGYGDVTIYAKWYELPIRQFKPDGKWHSIDPIVWQFGSDHQWHKVARVYKFVKNEGEEEGHWEDISGLLT